MVTLTRYVITEVLSVFLVTVLATLLLLTIAGAAREGINQGLPVGVIVRLIPFMIPEMLQFTVPGCLLFAVCSVFGRMAASHEIVAIKSVGIHPLTIVWPVLTLAYLISIFAFVIGDVSAWWSRANLKRVVYESIDDIAYGVLRTAKSFSSNGMQIVVKDVQDRKLDRPVIVVSARENTPPMTLSAREAELAYNKDRRSLRFRCRDGELEVTGKGSFSFPGWFVHDIPLIEEFPPPEHKTKPSELKANKIPRQIKYQEETIRQWAQELANANLPAARRAEIEKKFDQAQARLIRLRYERARRMSNGFSCLGFVLVGAPVAMWWRSADTMSVFFLCFLPILIVYYPLFVVGEEIARRGVVPSAWVWLADMVLFAIGATLLWTTTRR